MFQKSCSRHKHQIALIEGKNKTLQKIFGFCFLIERPTEVPFKNYKNRFFRGFFWNESRISS